MKLFEDSPVPAAAFSALTASSNLQQLVLHHTDLVDDAWAHVFEVMQPRQVQVPHGSLRYVQHYIDKEAKGGTSCSSRMGRVLVC